MVDRRAARHVRFLAKRYEIWLALETRELSPSLPGIDTERNKMPWRGHEAASLSPLACRKLDIDAVVQRWRVR